MPKRRDYKAEYRRRKQLKAEREAAAARERRLESQRRYRRRLRRARDAGFSSVREWERYRAQEADRIQEARQSDQLGELLGKQRKGSKLSNAGAIARYLNSIGKSPRKFFKAWYA